MTAAPGTGPTRDRARGRRGGRSARSPSPEQLARSRSRASSTTESLDVAAAVLAEHEHQVGRRRDDAPEVGGRRRVAATSAQREEERDREARDAERDLDDDQARRGCGRCSAAIVRAAFSDTFDVRSERIRSRAIGSVVWMCSCAVWPTVDGPSGEERASGARSGRATSRCSCSSCPRTTGSDVPETRVVVVTVHRRRERRRRGARCALSRRTAAVAPGRPGRRHGRAAPPSRSARTSVRWRAAISSTVARCCDREVAQIDRPTAIADESANVARIAAIGRRPEPANGENARLPRMPTRP